MIPQKLKKIKQTKQEIKTSLDRTHQNTNIPFRQYSNLIRNIPDSGAMTHSDVNRLTALAIQISGEEA